MTDNGEEPVVLEQGARYAIMGKPSKTKYRMKMVEVVETPPLTITDETTVQEVCQLINAALEKEGMRDLLGESMGVGMFPGVDSEAPFRTVLPKIRWYASWAARGSNEGHYLYVEAVSSPDSLRRVPGHLSSVILSGKTFSGMRDCAQVAARISELLEEWDW